MKKGFAWVIVTCIMVVSLVMSSCSSSTATAITSTSTTSSNAITSTSATSTLTTTNIATTTSVVTISSSSTGNWWDNQGVPKYGGTLTANDTTPPGFWDPNQGSVSASLEFCYLDSLFGANWTTDPSVQNYQLTYWDESYVTGDLLQDWEFTSPGNLVMHVRQGVYWQNLPPVNGREFKSSDIVFRFDRACGLGDGFTAPADPVYFASNTWDNTITSVSAKDDWTVVMTFSSLNPEFILENMEAPGAFCCIENPEAVQAYTNVSNPELTNWHNAVGDRAVYSDRLCRQ